MALTLRLLTSIADTLADWWAELLGGLLMESRPTGRCQPLVDEWLWWFEQPLFVRTAGDLLTTPTCLQRSTKPAVLRSYLGSKPWTRFLPSRPQTASRPHFKATQGSLNTRNLLRTRSSRNLHSMTFHLLKRNGCGTTPHGVQAGFRHV